MQHANIDKFKTRVTKLLMEFNETARDENKFNVSNTIDHLMCNTTPLGNVNKYEIICELLKLKCTKELIMDLFKSQGNINMYCYLVQNSKQFKNTINEIITEYKFTKDNVAEKYLERVSYKVSLVYFLKGKLKRCERCGKWTPYKYCSIDCAKDVQVF